MSRTNGHSRNGAAEHAADIARAAEVDPEAARQSMSRLQSIFRDIAVTADKSFKQRCPYKNAQTRCTARFGCSYQHFTTNPTALPVCTGSDKLDYRSAWESGADSPSLS